MINCSRMPTTPLISVTQKKICSMPPNQMATLSPLKKWFRQACWQSRTLQYLTMTAKLLVLTFDQHLRFTPHIDLLINRCWPAFHAIVKLGKAGVDDKSICYFYRSRVVPLLTLACFLNSLTKISKNCKKPETVPASNAAKTSWQWFTSSSERCYGYQYPILYSMSTLYHQSTIWLYTSSTILHHHGQNIQT